MNQFPYKIKYRMAVLLHESALLRSSYVNTISYFEAFSELIFENKYDIKEELQVIPFSSENIEELFADNHVNNLLTFDVLIISTNVTSDEEILNNLNSNKEIIKKFVFMDKGVFIFPQKTNNEEFEIQFLPEELCYSLIKRKDKKKSSEGKIDFCSNLYKNEISHAWTDEIINGNYVQNKEFSKHKYKLYIKNKYNWNYINILYDKESSKDTILLCRSNKWKVIITSMMLDHSQNTEMLKSCLKYLLKGLTTFIYVTNNVTNDDSLLKSLCLSSNNFDVMNFNETLTYDFDGCDSIVVNDDISNNDVDDLYNRALTTNKKINLYYFHSLDNNNHYLQQYSNCTQNDLILNRAISWLLSMFDNSNLNIVSKSTWKSNFWNGYDILKLLFDYVSLNINNLKKIYNEYLQKFLEENEHLKIKYTNIDDDSIFACNCAEFFLKVTNYSSKYKDSLNEELSELYKKYKNLCIEYVDIRNINFFRLMIYDIKHNPMLDNIINEFNAFLNIKYFNNKEIEYIKIKKKHFFNIDETELSEYLGILVCNILENSFNKNEIEELIFEVLISLNKKQNNGKIDSLPKTGKIITDLIKYILFNEQIFSKKEIFLLSAKIVDDGINYLIKNVIDLQNWNNSIISTAHSTSALLYYIKTGRLSLTDFDEKLEKDILKNKLYYQSLYDASISLYSYDKLKKLEDENKILKEYEKNYKQIQETANRRINIMVYIGLSAVFSSIFYMFKLFDNYKEIFSAICGIIFGGLFSYIISKFSFVKIKDVTKDNNKKLKEKKNNVVNRTND